MDISHFRRLKNNDEKYVSGYEKYVSGYDKNDLYYLSWTGNYEALFKAMDEMKVVPDYRGEITIWHNLAWSGNYEGLCKAIDEKRFNIDAYQNDIWFCFALSGNYEGLCKAIDEKRFDQSIIYAGRSNVWYYFARSGNYEGFCKAIDEKRFNPNNGKDSIWHGLFLSEDMEAIRKIYMIYKFDKNDIPQKYHHILREKTKIELLIEKLLCISNDIPDNFKCPISREIMVNPVINEYGKTYDSEYIEKWLEKNNTDPLTNMQLSTKILQPDVKTRTAIENWLQQ